MAGASQPLLVYNRIGANRRMTYALLAMFTVAMLFFISGMGSFIIVFADPGGGTWATPAFGAHSNGRAGAVARQLWDVLLRPFALAVTVIVGSSALISRYGAGMVLWMAQARRAARRDEPDLFRVVENLCIGAGLPTPGIHIVESSAPNAFATGRDPARASLVVTRGLLRLLDRRELEGVVAHELSHIGNNDIRLSTALVTVVGPLSVPLRLLTFLLFSHQNFDEGDERVHAEHAWAMVLYGGFFIVFGWLLTAFLLPPDMPTVLRWYLVHTLVAPIYAVFLAPVLILRIRQAVARRREYLADADAVLLTRDPEGLALALVKVGAAAAPCLAVDEAAVHLYFVDPTDRESWVGKMFPPHPPLEERLAVLERLGSSVGAAALRAARTSSRPTPPFSLTV
jgi:heat shock protein HtpX